MRKYYSISDRSHKLFQFHHRTTSPTPTSPIFSKCQRNEINYNIHKLHAANAFLFTLGREISINYVYYKQRNVFLDKTKYKQQNQMLLLIYLRTSAVQHHFNFSNTSKLNVNSNLWY